MNDKTIKKTRKPLLDVIFISAVILIALSIVLIFTLNRKSGNIAIVEINGERIAEYPLSKNGVFSLNGGSNVLVIEDGAAYLNYSDCPDHTCEKTGKIRYVGETIICLPNRISITVSGNSADGVDLVS